MSPYCATDLSRTGGTVNAPKLPYETGVVFSADGTPIGYRRLGAGPGLILLSGGYLAAQHYMGLAGALADAFTVYVPDRRGRGVSGPPGDRYGMDRECEDVAALLAESGAEFLFGHSSGGLIAQQAGRTLPQVTRLAVFEPPLSEHGSISSAWIGEFDRQVARGKPTTSYPRGGRVRCWSPCLRCTCVGRSAGSSSLMSRSRASSRSSG